MTKNLKLDHVVINIKDEMDEANQIFMKLGFLLSPRGFHSLGSINHSMMFKNDYLELIGFPKGGVIKRPALKNAPFGINGIVFKSDNIDQTYLELCNNNLNEDIPRNFSRPVKVKEKELDAKFRTVNVDQSMFEAGRIYFCEHLTPELLWIPKSTEHDNTSFEIKEVNIIDKEPHKLSQSFNKISYNIEVISKFDSISLATDDVSLNLYKLKDFKKRYQSVVSNMIFRDSMFGSLVFKVKSLFFLNELEKLNSNAFVIKKLQDKIQIFIKPYNCILEFIE